MDPIIVVLIVLAILVYFTPSLIGAARDVKDNLLAAVFFTNLLLGWSLIGWVAALVMSLSFTSKQVA